MNLFGEYWTPLLDSMAGGNAWARRAMFAFVAYFVLRAIWNSEPQREHFIAVFVAAVIAFEIAIVFLKLRQKDHALSDDALLAAQRRDTLVATAVLSAVLLVGAFVLSEPWSLVLGVVFGYAGYLFSRYMPEALFSRRQEHV